MGLTLGETMSVPFGLLQDLVAIHQIKVEGAERVLTQEDEQDEFFRLLSFS